MPCKRSTAQWGEAIGVWQHGFGAERISGCLCVVATLAVFYVPQSGGTIGVWQKYFGAGLTMYGMDINPYCKVNCCMRSISMLLN